MSTAQDLVDRPLSMASQVPVSKSGYISAVIRIFDAMTNVPANKRLSLELQYEVMSYVMGRELTALDLPQSTSFDNLPLSMFTNMDNRTPSDMLSPPARHTAYLARKGAHPALKPPRSGACPFMKIPGELRRQILADSLPDRDVVYEPCDIDEQASITTLIEGIMTRSRSMTKEVMMAKPRHNFLSGLMTLNKTISGEIAEVLYEGESFLQINVYSMRIATATDSYFAERTFAIHIFEGLRHGGIEILNTGRQPLQYQENIGDDRFHKFGANSEFGFRRLKKIILRIYPTTEESCRHTAINTYFVNLALCRLLDRSSGDKHRITSLRIEFPEPKITSKPAGRASIQRADHYWWNSDDKKPRETSIQFLSNIELVLRPFANLTNCHAVSIELPEKLRTHTGTLNFVADLIASMTSSKRTLFMDDDLEMKIEAARSAMEDYVFSTLHGNVRMAGEKLTEAEMTDDGLGDSADEDEELGHGGDVAWLSQQSDDPGEIVQLAMQRLQRRLIPPSQAWDQALAITLAVGEMQAEGNVGISSSIRMRFQAWFEGYIDLTTADREGSFVSGCRAAAAESSFPDQPGPSQFRFQTCPAISAYKPFPSQGSSIGITDSSRGSNNTYLRDSRTSSGLSGRSRARSRPTTSTYYSTSDRPLPSMYGYPSRFGGSPTATGKTAFFDPYTLPPPYERPRNSTPTPRLIGQTATGYEIVDLTGDDDDFRLPAASRIRSALSGLRPRLRRRMNSDSMLHMDEFADGNEGS